MEQIISYDTIRSFAYVNDKLCSGKIKGVVLDFFGLGGMKMYDEDPEDGVFFAERGILYVVPYNNPWAWMNRQAVAYTDEILDVLFAAHRLDDDIPIVSTGGSMGGLSALIYARYAKRTPAACVANCPVCDLVFHYSERPDLPRTLYSAFWNYAGSLEEALKSASPLHLADSMPRIPYRLFHCDCDTMVNLQSHSEKFADEMRARGYDVSLDIVPGRGHCDLTEDMRARYRQYCVEAVES